MLEIENKDEDPSSRKSHEVDSGSNTPSYGNQSSGTVPNNDATPNNSLEISPCKANGTHVRVSAGDRDPQNIFKWIQNLVKGRSDSSLRDAIEEYIEEGAALGGDIGSTSAHERALLSNILELRDVSVFDAMIPRADIIAIDINTTQEELFSVLAEKQHSRLPVYNETLDNLVGTIHIKDILACLARGNQIEMTDLIRDVPIISPAMHVLDLLLMFKQMRKHMALVVDEYGGIDGLITIGDVIESIVGEIDDEYDIDDTPTMRQNSDGSVLVDARLDLNEFEKHYGQILDEDEREDIETLGGLVFALAGRVPARGEILTHPTGMVFEVVDADPRRISRLLIKNIPELPENNE